jgi:molecular chaperone GrpE
MKKESEFLIRESEYLFLKEQSAKAEENWNKYLRARADLENYRKRVLKEKVEFSKFANEQLILEILPVVDNFERACQETKKKANFEILFKGMEMILEQLRGVLKKHGVKEIKAVGKKFDPKFHHAVENVITDKKEEENLIAEETQKGYLLEEKVIRPSLVKVFKKKEA